MTAADEGGGGAASAAAVSAARAAAQPPAPPLRHVVEAAAASRPAAFAQAPAPPIALAAAAEAREPGGAAAAARDASEDEAALFPDGSFAFDHLALGGTFDRLHSGHRLMLAVAAALTRGLLYLGITADALLHGKPYAALVQPAAARSAAAAAYLASVRPGLRVDASSLTGEPPKAVTHAHMQALVISRETAAGGEAVQAQRAARGYPPLQMLTVDLVGADSQSPMARKLSSSGLRALEAEAEEAPARDAHLPTLPTCVEEDSRG